MLPTFIGIGPGRTGTSMFYELLLQHPEVSMAKGTMVTNYFGAEYHRGPDWYAHFFEHGIAYKAVGEITTAYFLNPDAPARMYEILPNIRLFSFLRHPFDHMRSVYLYRKRAGTISQDLSLEAAIRRFPDLVTINCYATCLNKFLEYYRRNQILIMLYEDLKAQPEAFAQEVLAFLGIDSNFTSDVLYQRINAAAEPRSRLIGKLAKVISQSLRNRDMLSILSYAKRSSLIRGIALTSVKPKTEAQLALSQEMILRLQEEWKPEIEQIEKLVNRDLQHWLENDS